IKGCPVNGPKIIAHVHDVAVAWFSMPDDKPQVKVVFSDNDGESFTEPVRVDKGNPIGRVDLEWLDNEAAFVIWMENSTIMGARVEPTGVVWRINISASSEARSSGFPQVTRHKNQLIVAWTDDQIKQVKTAIINL
ncbi:MAG: exo-alpha-sialidase, partial [Cyclobacteriaceae bacterium]|nr:exo-alpha-sialidase [Cyclobacteriaceae bacterium]